LEQLDTLKKNEPQSLGRRTTGLIPVSAEARHANMGLGFVVTATVGDSAPIRVA
jgi:hypothetical protein